MQSIPMKTHDGEGRCNVYDDVVECPNCHNLIIPKALYARIREDNKGDIMFQCPDSTYCQACFVMTCNDIGSAGYVYRPDGKIFKGTLRSQSFDDLIRKVSPSFMLIYNEAFTAEQQGLGEICGVGYRKAIEFLVKDFAVMNNPQNDDEIKKMPLMQCIKKFIDSNNVKKVAERAVWLGNDETHYVRVWESKDIQDLKKLIALTVHWIEAELLTKELEDDMPRKS